MVLGYDAGAPALVPEALRNAVIIELEHYHYGERQLCCECRNCSSPTTTRMSDACTAPLTTLSGWRDDYIVWPVGAVNPQHIGTKARTLSSAPGPGETTPCACGSAHAPSAHAETPLPRTLIRSSPHASTADEFGHGIRKNLSPDAQSVMRQALGGPWSNRFITMSSNSGCAVILPCLPATGATTRPQPRMGASV
jgi:hypothetical protein